MHMLPGLRHTHTQTSLPTAQPAACCPPGLQDGLSKVPVGLAHCAVCMCSAPSPPASLLHNALQEEVRVGLTSLHLSMTYRPAPNPQHLLCETTEGLFVEATAHGTFCTCREMNPE